MLPYALYLVTTPEFDVARDRENLRKIIDVWKPSALRLTTTDASEARQIVEQIGSFVQASGTALILTNLPDLARELNCDGVHFTYLPSDTAHLRSEAGVDLQIGIACHARRDEVMRAGELGADYISISGSAPESILESTSVNTPSGAPGDPYALAQWWSQMMELPMIAEDITDSAQARMMVEAGVDFVAVPLDFRDAQAAEDLLKQIFSMPEEERRL